MLRRILFSLFFFLVTLQVQSQLACGQDIDLNSWVREGSETDGTWTVSADGKSVEQSINGEPTFFVSPDTFINVIMEGKIKVNTANDDDLIGFVFGYNNPTGVIAPDSMMVQTYVFDWKQAEQTDQGGRSQEGYALYKVDGIVDYTDYPGSSGPVFWARDDTPISTMLANNYGDNGWNDFQEYTFKLRYTAWNVTIWIDGVEVINFDDCYHPGRFGFYNSSQNFVIYSDFTYQYIADFDVINPDICVNDTGLFAVGFNDCPYSGFYPHGTTFEWDFDDGQYGEGRSEKHKYEENGVYDVILTVTDPLGCADTSVHPINVTWLTVNVIDSAAMCVGEDTLINANTNGIVKYLWSDGSTDSVLYVNQTGDYIIRVEDAVGCIGIDTVEVVIQDNPEIDLGKDVNNCKGDSVLVGETIAGVKYLWSTGDSTDKIMINTSGEYWVDVVTSGGCSNSDTINVNYSGPTVLLPLDTNLCENLSPLTIQALATDHLDVLWNTGATTLSIESNQTETLKITVTDKHGCSFSDSMEVYFEAVPDVKLPNDTALCKGDTIIAGDEVEDVSFIWTGPGVTGQQNKDISIYENGIYVLRVSSNLGCSDVDSIEVLFTGPSVALPNDKELCSNEVPINVEVSALDYKSILWNTGHIGLSVSSDKSEMLKVMVADATGCTASDSINIYVEEVPSIQLPSDTALCVGDELLVGEEMDNVSYLWSGPTIDGSSSSTVLISTDGTYSLKVSSGIGCSDEDDIVVSFEEAPWIDLGEDTTICFQKDMAFTKTVKSNAVEYKWSTGDTSKSIQITEIGKYSVLVSSPIGCSNTDEYEVEDFCPYSIYFPNAFTPNGDGKNDLFPTPYHNLVSYKLFVFNRWGQLLFEGDSTQPVWDGTFNNIDCQTDVYVWKAIWEFKNEDGTIESSSKVGHVSLIR